MKYIWRGLGALVLAASLAACGSSGPSDASTSTPQAPATAEAANPNLPALEFVPVTNWLISNPNPGFSPYAQIRLVLVNRACLLETKSKVTNGLYESDFTPMPLSACAAG